jgi:long-chain acyl-CoA synthetase
MEQRLWHAAYPAGLPRDLDFDEGETLVTLLERSFARYAPRTAVSCAGESLTFAEVERASALLARYLQAAGLERGDRVALLLPNTLLYPVALAAILRAGMVGVTMNPLYTARELQYQLGDSGAAALLAGEPFMPLVAEALDQTQVRHVLRVPMQGVRQALLAPAAPSAVQAGGRDARSVSLCDAVASLPPSSFTAAQVQPSDLAFLQYTGGTTGVSKGACLTHRSVLASVLQRAPFDMLIGVNTLYNAMVASPELSKVDFSRCRLAIGAGASIQEAVAKKWVQAGGPPITEAYGLTETSPSVSFNAPGRNGTIGAPVPSTDVLIVDDAGQPVPPGTPGELLIKGPQVFAGYWKREEETRKAFTADGWFKTGDVVTMDEQGLMYIVDRKKDMILVSGFNVYPNEIEAVVAMHPEVLECACIGVPDERSAEAPHLFVVRRSPGLLAEELEAHCRKLLAPYKVPRHITFVEALPKSAVGKILRKELRPQSAAIG